MQGRRIDPEELEHCGESFDHEEELLSEGEDGGKTYVCSNCGAELYEEPDE